MDIAQKMLTTFNDDSDLLKNVIWWRIMGFATIEEIKEKSKQELLAIPKCETRISRIGKNVGISVLDLLL